MFKPLVFISAIFFASSTLVAAEKAHPNGDFAVVSIRDVMQKIPQSEAVNQKLENEFATRRQAIVKLQEELQTKNQKYQKDMDLLGDAEKKKAERELFEKQRELQRLEYEYREDAQVRQREETELLLAHVQKVIARLAASNHFQFVFHKDALIHSDAKLDITDKVIHALKQETQGQKKDASVKK